MNEGKVPSLVHGNGTSQVSVMNAMKVKSCKNKARSFKTRIKETKPSTKLSYALHIKVRVKLSLCLNATPCHEGVLRE
jgi:hypothetical protein